MNKFGLAIFLLSLLVSGNANAGQQSKERFKISFDGNKQTCGDIVSMLNDPINKNYSTYKNEVDKPDVWTDFLIPEKYKEKYTRPEWIDVPKDELVSTGLNKEVIDYISNRLQKAGYYDLQVTKRSGKNGIVTQKTVRDFDFDNEWEDTGIQRIYKYSFNAFGTKQKFPIGTPVCKVPGEHEYLYSRYYSYGCSFLNVNNSPDGNISLFRSGNKIRVIWAHSRIQTDSWGNTPVLDITKLCEFTEQRSQ